MNYKLVECSVFAEVIAAFISPLNLQVQVLMRLCPIQHDVCRTR